MLQGHARVGGFGQSRSEHVSQEQRDAASQCAAASGVVADYCACHAMCVVAMREAMRKEAVGDMFARFTPRIDKLTSKLDLALKRTLKNG